MPVKTVAKKARTRKPAARALARVGPKAEDGNSGRLLYVRGIDPALVRFAKDKAAARRIKMSDYFAALIALHRDLFGAAQSGDADAARVLESHGLQPITS